MNHASDIFQTPIEYLKLVGPERARIFSEEWGMKTFGDLLLHLPYRYEDRRKVFTIAEIDSEEHAVQVAGEILDARVVAHGRKKRLVARFSDGHSVMQLVWFRGLQYFAKSVRPGRKCVIYGKPNRRGNEWSIVHPELQDISSEKTEQGLVPVYHTTEKAIKKGLNSKNLWKVIQTNLPKLQAAECAEALPPETVKQYRFPDVIQTFHWIHCPESMEQVNAARNRLKYEELFFLQLSLAYRQVIRKTQLPGISFPQVGDFFNTYYHRHLPFDLTNAQKRVLKEIRRDMASGRQMNRLLQGDVGSGKTIVALLSMLLAMDNGYQAVIMAPTEILAQQHARFFGEAMEPLGIRSALLTSSVKGAERKAILAGIESGEIHFLIGTHAVIQDTVNFHRLGLAVIDEQHRFGVAQRARLWKKGKQPPHVLVMTATPIPRTLSMTFYGDLDVSVIDELPPGRKPIQTVHRYDASRDKVFGFMEKEIALGRQVYVVYPLIEESQKLDYKDLMDGYESIVRRFPRPDFQVSMVHGQMKPEAKEWEMQRFVKGETHIMVATTVIEVGVNVPNASVMVVESAERFGLSQLHQLRGRIGRGADQSYCILMSSQKLSAEARKRLGTMVSTQDGFKIAEVDLQLRGPGDVMGTQQSGTVQLKVADLLADRPILQQARKDAFALLDRDPELKSPGLRHIKTELNRVLQEKMRWSKIS